RSVRVWETGAEKELYRLDLKDGGSALAFSRACRTLAAGGGAGGGRQLGGPTGSGKLHPEAGRGGDPGRLARPRPAPAAATGPPGDGRAQGVGQGGESLQGRGAGPRGPLPGPLLGRPDPGGGVPGGGGGSPPFDPPVGPGRPRGDPPEGPRGHRQVTQRPGPG